MAKPKDNKGSQSSQGSNKSAKSTLHGLSNLFGQVKVSKTTRPPKGSRPPTRTNAPRGTKNDALDQIKKTMQDEVDGKKDRKSEYPSGYEKQTHNNMALNHTDQGRNGEITIDSKGDLVDGKGNRVPRDSLTWRDSKGNKIEFYGVDKHGDRITNLTYEHRDSIVQHWNRHGYNSPYADRFNHYNDWTNMEAMGRGPNSSGGGAMKDNYRQDTGSNYTNKAGGTT